MHHVPAAAGDQDPDAIQTAADFARALQALRDRSGLRIREVARLTGGQRSTVGGYFSGQHLPLDRELLTRLLMVCGEDDPARIERWQLALIRVRRRPRRRSEAPYRGLARYEEADAQWFFGREDVTDLLVSLGTAPSELPLMLIGPSGAGKSSVLRAGLLPRLDEMAWQADVIDLSVTGVRELTMLAVRLTAGGAGPDAPAAGDAGRRAVIVDQFEAVFTLCDDEDERNALVGALCELARSVLVVLALRADFYGRAIGYPGLRQALQERHVVLGPMTAGQVRDAVVRPALLARAEVDEGLVALLLADLGPAGQGRPAAHEAGALPLLSHAMLATWEHSRGGTLAVADYQASGGIRNALTQTAEQAYESLTDGQRRLARQLFLRLVHVADGVPPSRASVALGDLAGRDQAGDAEAVLATFVAGAHDHRGRGRGADHSRRAAHRLAPAAGLDRGKHSGTARPGPDRRGGAGLVGGQPRGGRAVARQPAGARAGMGGRFRQAVGAVRAGALVRGRVGGGRGRHRARGPATDPLAASHRRRAGRPGARSRRAFRLRLQSAVGGPQSRGRGPAGGRPGGLPRRGFHRRPAAQPGSGGSRTAQRERG